MLSSPHERTFFKHLHFQHSLSFSFTSSEKQQLALNGNDFWSLCVWKALC